MLFYNTLPRCDHSYLFQAVHKVLQDQRKDSGSNEYCAHLLTFFLSFKPIQMQPSAGQGAVSAMQDAVVLVNCIYEIENVTYENIKAALADYRAQRYEHAAFQVNLGKTLAKIMFGQVNMLQKTMANMPCPPVKRFSKIPHSFA